MIRDNMLKPEPAIIKKVEQESKCAKTFTLKFKNPKTQKKFRFLPGKFVEVSIPGAGEMPISICSSPHSKNSFQLTVADVGGISKAMCGLDKGDEIGIRGPYGKPFPIPRFKGKNIVLVAGGLGMAPLRPVIYSLLPKEEQFGKIVLFYGAREPCDLVFLPEMRKWKKSKNISVSVTVDKPTCEWRGGCGVVTDLFGDKNIQTENTVVLMCGPPVMIHFSALKLEKMGISPKNMYASMERLMHCGIGKCAHCNIGNKYVCIDGPVFTVEELRRFEKEA